MSDLYCSLYNYIPDLGANAAALSGFSVVWALNTAFGIYTKQWWFGGTFFVGAGLEVGGYIARTLAHSDPCQMNDFLVQIIFLTIAPAFFMAGVYILLAKFTVIYGCQTSRLQPLHYSYIFASCDLLSIVLQGIGGGMAAVALNDDADTDPGTHVMVAGMAVQVASMSLFFLLCADFMWRIHKREQRARELNPTLSGMEIDTLLFEPKYQHIRTANPKYFRLSIVSIGITSGLIYIRCVYRLAELSQGWTGYLISHEAYFLIFEALIVFLGTFTLTVFHPGFVFGRDAHIPIKGLNKTPTSPAPASEIHEQTEMDPMDLENYVTSIFPEGKVSHKTEISSIKREETF